MSLYSNLIGKVLIFTIDYSIENKICKGKGKINFEDSNEFTIYASWNVLDENNNILVSKSRKYFIDKLSDSDIINEIKNNIINYRIGRKKVFTNIIICE